MASRKSHSNKNRFGFTLVEVLVAMAIGSVVVVIAFTAFQLTAKTVKAVNRLAVQNQVLRAGFAYALDESDYWILYDDPDASPGSSGQGLRRQGDYDMGGLSASERYGLPFTPLRDVSVANEFTASPDTWTIRENESALDSPYTFTDDDEIFRRDHDRGWDPRRPYRADDPREWYRGTTGESTFGFRRGGRYGMFSNLSSKPILGLGTDPQHFQSYGGPKMAGAINTGPYGPYSPSTWGANDDGELPNRTFTWRENRIRFIWHALGNYAVFDYLPANTVFATHGSWTDTSTMPSDDAWDESIARGLVPAASAGTFIVIDEQPSRTTAGRILPNTGYFPTGFLTTSINAWYAMTPGNGYSGSYNNGYYSDSGSDRNPDTSLSLNAMLSLHRDNGPGPNNHDWAIMRYLARNVMAVPLLPQRPDDWPDLRIAVQRGLLQGRFHALCRIRWMDQATGQIVELPVVSLGSSLRGARQQRRPDGGWAHWAGPLDHSRYGALVAPDYPRHFLNGNPAINDPTLDSPP